MAAAARPPSSSSRPSDDRVEATREDVAPAALGGSSELSCPGSQPLRLEKSSPQCSATWLSLGGGGCGSVSVVDDASLSMTHHENAPNCGEPCPCGHDPPGPVPVYRAPKKKPLNSSTQREDRASAVSPVPVVAHNGRGIQRISQRDKCLLHSGTSTTLSMNCNWGITVVCRINWTMGNSLCVTTGMSTTCRCTQQACERPCPRATISQRAATMGSRL